MRWLTLTAVLFAACGQTGLNLANDGGVDTVMAVDASPDLPALPDYMRPDSVLPSVSADGGECQMNDLWFFVNHNVYYCGSLTDACKYVCGWSDGCIVGNYTTAMQVAYCPSDKP